ncbi:hypothetical protein EV356DRAFT_499042 [Viridothelium virens]|uniref:CENP-V/GFA domain-containing protein n=1 Tax=Viridothelium virens TaxID=1048519 RepID=A0A6A6GRR6_VIRVR|nr:hypothetical protein EV356DRAFT_499042 [Viridothelium virens]
MSATTTVIKASCLCGKANFTVTLPSTSLPLRSWICHCDTCRKNQGSIALFHTEIPALDSASVSPLSVYKTSENSNRYFCPVCGCHPCEWDEGVRKWYLSTGVIQREDFPLIEFTEHIFIEDTKDGGLSNWLPSVNGKLLKRWSHHARKSQELPLSWASSELQSTPSDKLRARCSCGGVDFYISRPLFDSPEFRKDFPDLKIPSETVPRSKEHWFIAKDKQKWIAGFCTCTSCRLANGMDVMSWTYVPTSLITPADGSSHRLEFGTLKRYQSSDKVIRRFCGKCGATVFYQVDHRPNLVDVAVGLLESTSGAKAEDWLEWRKDDFSFRDEARDTKLVEELLHGYQAQQQR